MIDARRTELLTIRIEHGARIAPDELIEALQTIPGAMACVNICTSHGLIAKNGDSVSVTSWVKWNGKWHDIQDRAAARTKD